jgi:hypothetical protein
MIQNSDAIWTYQEDAYNNKRGRSPEVYKTSRQRRRYRNGDNYERRNQIAAGYEGRNEEGFENKEFQIRDSRGKEKSRYSGPSAEDMIYGPCRIHYAYLDGKRVSNHKMKDCRSFLRLQNAMDSSQGTRQGGKSVSQGYQMQRLAKQLESKVYISAMIQPVPKSKKERKSISRQVNLAISSPPTTTEYLQWSDQPVRFSRADHPRKVPRLGHAPMVLNIRENSKGNVHFPGKSKANILFFPQNSARKRKLPPWENRTRRLLRQ